MSDWQPLGLSFEIAAIATVVATTIGIAIGWLVASRRFIGRDLVDAVTSMPMVLPPTVVGYYMIVALGRGSAIGRVWHALFGTQIVFTRTGVVIAATIGSLPFVIKSARAALEGVDQTLLKAARTLGAGPLRTFLTVHLPLASRGIAAGVMLAFAHALGDFGATLMVGGDIPGETQTASLAIYDNLQAQQDRVAAGMAAVLTSIAIGALYLANKLAAVRRDEA